MLSYWIIYAGARLLNIFLLSSIITFINGLVGGGHILGLDVGEF
jgi:hypothetical protein